MENRAPLTYARVARFYSPLALSWIFMAMESPICVAMLSRRWDPEVQTAAYTALAAMSLWIESPVIDLLTTSTTLSKGPNSLRSMRRFALIVMAIATAMHAAIALTPLYDWITLRLLHYPQPVAEAARTAMQVMIPWSACIGWRRFLQGVLIRNGMTKRIGFGTAVRVGAIAGVAALLSLTTRLPGATVAAWALVASVFAEMLFVHFAARGVVQSILSREDPSDAPIPTGQIWKFHLPLTLTTMVTLCGPLLASAALSRSPMPVLGLAGYQVASALIWLHRTAVYALPEAVITLLPEDPKRSILSRFCTYVGLGSTALMGLLALTGIDRLIFVNVLHATPGELDVAHLAFVASLLLPVLGAWQCYARAVLAYERVTIARLYAILAGVAVAVGLLEIGIAAGWTGVLSVAFAFSVSLVIELAILGYFAGKHGNKLPLEGAPEYHETPDQAAETA